MEFRLELFEGYGNEKSSWASSIAYAYAMAFARHFLDGKVTTQKATIMIKVGAG